MITQMELLEHIKSWLKPVDWEAAFTAELPRVYNYFRYRGFSDDAAEELVSTVFEKAWRSRDDYRRERGAVSTWLLAIARRAAIDQYRACRGDVDIDELVLPAPHPGPEELALHGEQIERLRRLLAQLPEREQELVALKYGAGLTNRAIARHTGLSESNVGTILSRVVNRLRADMEQ
jgi:RNA polymerase sigma-70 factor, ECF subfamily